MSSTLKPLGILLVHSHEIMRGGLRAMLESDETIFRYVVDEADSGRAAITQARARHFAIAIIGYDLPDMKGTEAIIELRLINPHTRYLFLSGTNEAAHVRAMARAGALGHISTNISTRQLLGAIRSVYQNNTYYSADIVRQLEEGCEAPASNALAEAGLTRRELEILMLVAQEKTNEEMAAILFISRRTVDTHRQNLMHKLKVKNTAGLLKAAYQLKIV